MLRFGTTALRTRHQISVPSPSHSLLSKGSRFIRCRLATPAAGMPVPPLGRMNECPRPTRSDRLASDQTTRGRRAPSAGPAVVALVIFRYERVRSTHRPGEHLAQWTLVQPPGLFDQSCTCGLPQDAAYVTLPFPTTARTHVHMAGKYLRCLSCHHHKESLWA